MIPDTKPHSQLGKNIVFKMTLYKLLPLFLLVINISLKAQDIDAHSPQPSTGSHQQQIADKKKLKQQKQITKDIEKGEKRHMKLQAKNTRKMMRKSKRTSKQWNDK